MEVTLKDFLKLMLKRWWILLLAIIVGGAGIFLFMKLRENPQYSSEAVFMVDYVGDTGGSSGAASDLNYSKSLIANFIVILQQNTFSDKVRTEMVEKHSDEFSAADLSYSISYSSAADTSKIVATVTSGSSELSLKVGEVIQKMIPGYIEVMYPSFDSTTTTIGSINTVVRGGAVSSSYTMYVVVGALLGLIIAAVVVFLVDKFDIRVKSEKDLKERYGLPILGVIPSFVDKNEEKKNIGRNG